MPAVDKPAPPRIVLTIPEAAGAIGMSITKFRVDVLPGLRVIRMGNWRGVAVAELEQWAEANSALRE
jgi:hypothetical protein